MGRKPTPTPILQLRGSWKAKRGYQEPAPRKRRPRRPQSLDNIEKQCWDYICGQLEDMGILAEIDRNALHRYCNMWARWRAATDFIKTNGTTYAVYGGDGKVKRIAQFPQVSQSNRLNEQLCKIESEFAMTPASRTKVAVGLMYTTPNRDDVRKYFKRSG